MAAATGWQIRGSYFESCNCDPICPCRRIDGAAGDRSTHGICAGVLSWLIAEELAVDDGPLSFEFEGTCGYAATFSYSG